MAHLRAHCAQADRSNQRRSDALARDITDRQREHVRLAKMFVRMGVEVSTNLAGRDHRRYERHVRRDGEGRRQQGSLDLRGQFEIARHPAPPDLLLLEGKLPGNGDTLLRDRLHQFAVTRRKAVQLRRTEARGARAPLGRDNRRDNEPMHRSRWHDADRCCDSFLIVRHERAIRARHDPMGGNNEVIVWHRAIGDDEHLALALLDDQRTAIGADDPACLRKEHRQCIGEGRCRGEHTSNLIQKGQLVIRVDQFIGHAIEFVIGCQQLTDHRADATQPRLKCWLATLARERSREPAHHSRYVSSSHRDHPVRSEIRSACPVAPAQFSDQASHSARCAAHHASTRATAARAS